MRNIKLYESVADPLFYPSEIYPSRIAPRRESRGGQDMNLPNFHPPYIYTKQWGHQGGTPLNPPMPMDVEVMI